MLMRDSIHLYLIAITKPLQEDSQSYNKAMISKQPRLVKVSKLRVRTCTISMHQCSSMAMAVPAPIIIIIPTKEGLLI